MTKRKIIVEVYSRVVGYFRPISNWNKGKKEEYRQRKETPTNDIENIIKKKVTK